LIEWGRRRPDRAGACSAQIWYRTQRHQQEGRALGFVEQMLRTHSQPALTGGVLANCIRACFNHVQADLASHLYGTWRQ
jgi:hypothetical protein